MQILSIPLRPNLRLKCQVCASGADQWGTWPYLFSKSHAFSSSWPQHLNFYTLFWWTLTVQVIYTSIQLNSSTNESALFALDYLYPLILRRCSHRTFEHNKGCFHFLFPERGPNALHWRTPDCQLPSIDRADSKSAPSCFWVLFSGYHSLRNVMLTQVREGQVGLFPSVVYL